jgi:hypothetical protein
MKLKTGYFFDFMLCKWLKYSMILFLLFWITCFQEAQSNVRPDVLSWTEFPADIYGFTGSGARNFSPKQDIPVSPYSGNAPDNNAKPQPESEKCFIQESFRIYADRGQDPALLVFSGIFTGYPNHLKSTIYCLSFVYISSKTGESARIRPPPVI